MAGGLIAQPPVDTRPAQAHNRGGRLSTRPPAANRIEVPGNGAVRGAEHSCVGGRVVAQSLFRIMLADDSPQPGDVDQVIGQIENAVDETFANLRIFTLPLHQALYNLLWAFEGRLFGFDRQFGRLSPTAFINALNYKEGLNLLASKASSVCSRLSTDGMSFRRGDWPLESDVDGLQSARDALAFAGSYARLSDAFTFFHHEQTKASVDGRIVTFKYASDEARHRQALNIASQNYVARYQPARGNNGPTGDEVLEELRACATATNDRLALVPTERLWRLCRDMAAAETRTGLLPPEVSCGGYSVGHFEEVWLWIRALAHLADYVVQLCRDRGASLCISPSAVWSPLVAYESSALVGQIEGLSGLPAPLVQKVVDDLAFDPDEARGDIEVRPLIPMGSEYIIAPHLILTYRWEDNLFRLWNSLYPNEYGGNVAAQKRSLARHVAEAFGPKDTTVSPTDRVIRDRSGRHLTDVDLAVASVKERCVLLVEVKWPIAPGTAKEVRKADDEVLKGFGQLTTARRALHDRTREVLPQLFPDLEGGPFEVDSIHCLLLVHGCYPSARVGPLEFPIHPASAAIDYLFETNKTTLRAIIQDLEKPPRVEQMGSDYVEFEVSIVLAGYDFRIPAWSSAEALRSVEPAREQARRNQLCPCGSGVKYKKCCTLATGGKFYHWHRTAPVTE